MKTLLCIFGSLHWKRIFANTGIVLFVLISLYVCIHMMSFLRNSTFFYPQHKINTINPELLCAVRYANLPLVKKLMNEGVKCTGKDENGRTILYHADHQPAEMFIYLAENGNCDLNTHDNFGFTVKDLVGFKRCPHCGLGIYKYLHKRGAKHSWKYFFWDIWNDIDEGSMDPLNSIFAVWISPD